MACDFKLTNINRFSHKEIGDENYDNGTLHEMQRKQGNEGRKGRCNEERNGSQERPMHCLRHQDVQDNREGEVRNYL